MKKTLIFLCCFAMLTALCACSGETLPPKPTGTPAAPERFETPETPVPLERPETTKAPQTSKPVHETPASPAPSETPLPEGGSVGDTAPAVPYTEQILRADQMIFDGPGYDYDYAGTVCKAGIYTIVEEFLDTEDNLWGRLKSGAGWIDLSDARAFSPEKTPISVGFANDTELGEEYYEYKTGAAYSDKAAIRAYVVLKDVQISSLGWDEKGYKIDSVLYTLPELSAGKVLVAELTFLGSMSAYGVSFTDAKGIRHHFSISSSGRNGTLVLNEMSF